MSIPETDVEVQETYPLSVTHILRLSAIRSFFRCPLCHQFDNPRFYFAPSNEVRFRALSATLFTFRAGRLTQQLLPFTLRDNSLIVSNATYEDRMPMLMHLTTHVAGPIYALTATEDALDITISFPNDWPTQLWLYACALELGYRKISVFECINTYDPTPADIFLGIRVSKVQEIWNALVTEYREQQVCRAGTKCINCVHTSCPLYELGIEEVGII